MTAARLRALHLRYSDRPDLDRQLAEGVASGSRLLERAGAALLRLRARERGGLDAGAWTIVVDALPEVQDWAGRLQLCQLLAEHPALADAAPRELADFAQACAKDRNTFVRAWGVTALHSVGQRHAEFRALAKRVVAQARKDPAPSMRARLRRLA